MKQDPVFGDRHIEFTLIGLPAAREAFAAALQDALCTDAEVGAHRRAATSVPWLACLQFVPLLSAHRRGELLLGEPSSHFDTTAAASLPTLLAAA